VHAHVHFHLSGINAHNHVSDAIDVEDMVKVATDLALAFALRSKHFLQDLLSRTAEEQQELWDFGDLPDNNNDNSPKPSPLGFDRSAAPKYWFGPGSTHLAEQLLYVCDRVATRLSKGRKLFRKYFPFKMSFYEHCPKDDLVAQHWAYGNVVLCPPAVDLLLASPFLHGNPALVFEQSEFHGNIGGVPGLAIVIFHEMTHHLTTPAPNPTYLWDLVRGPQACRDLVLDGDFAAARGNIDNYAHWAAAGFFLYGSCEVFDIHRIPHDCVQAYDNNGDAIAGQVTCCFQCLDHTADPALQCTTCGADVATADGCP
jgi:hypothetical protein